MVDRATVFLYHRRQENLSLPAERQEHHPERVQNRPVRHSHVRRQGLLQHRAALLGDAQYLHFAQHACPVRYVLPQHLRVEVVPAGHARRGDRTVPAAVRGHCVLKRPGRL